MRIRSFIAIALAAATLPVLGGCSLLGGSAKTAATAASTASATSAASGGHSPSAGPVEAASALPKECSRILTTTQLQAVFGPGFPIGVNYGSYAPLTGIGRTGRVACIFGVGLDSFGKQSSGSLEVSISTYTSAANAAGRAADTVRSDAQSGATEAAVSVGGHPATIVVEQASAATGSASATAAATASPAVSGAATATATATASADNGETELVMADGNRTFVLQIPLAKLDAQQAATALTQLMPAVYRNTLPAAGSSGASAAPSSSTR